MSDFAKKKILVLGGGFAGIAVIKRLLKHKMDLRSEITLIDKNPFHLFTPSLYEVATSEEPQKNIVIPFNQLFSGKISYIREHIKIINQEKHLVITTNNELYYDYLILCLGSEPAYYNIPGLEEYSISLKTLYDAVEIKRKIKSVCCKENSCKRKAKVIIGGGGFTGTELAAELLTYKDRLAKQYGLAKDCLETTIIQGSDRLLKELDEHVSDLARKRLTNPQINFAFGGHITKVTNKFVFTDKGISYPYDIFIWTGGVVANKLASNSSLPVNERGQAVVNNFLQVNENIFAAGDITGFIDSKTKLSVPNVAQVAEDQGAIAGENVYRFFMNKPLIPYHFRHWGYVVPLKGKYAAAELMGNLHFDGFIGWLLQQAIFLWYLLGILPINKAFRKWNKFEFDLLHQS